VGRGKPKAASARESIGRGIWAEGGGRAEKPGAGAAGGPTLGPDSFLPIDFGTFCGEKGNFQGLSFMGLILVGFVNQSKLGVQGKGPRREGKPA